MKQTNKLKELRKRAEKLLKDKNADTFKQYQDDVEKLMQELNVHQIELEMQNEELKKYNAQIIKEQEKYKELYESAPIAYFTLNETGNIIKLNTAAAELLCLPIREVYYASIFPYIATQSKRIFTKYFKEVFSTDKKVELDEIQFVNRNDKMLYTKLQAISYFDEEYDKRLCRLTVTDITKQKQTERALKESERKYKEAQIVGNVGHWEYNIVEDKLFWSEHVYKMYELSPDDFEANFDNVVARFHPKDRQRVVDEFFEAVEEGTDFYTTHRIITSSGNIKFITEKAVITYNEDGKALSALGTIADITGRKKAEIALRESEKKFKMIFNNVNDAVGLHRITNDGISHFIEVNEKACQMLEYSKEELLALSPMQIMDEQLQENFTELFDKLMQQKQLSFESVHTTKSGKTIPVEINTLVFEMNDEMYLTTVTRDITERKKAEKALRESEAKFKYLMKHVPIPLCFVNQNGVFEYFNDKFHDVMGYTAQDLPTLDLWWQKAYPDEKYRKWVIDNWDRAVKESTKSNNDIKPDIYRLRCKNGKIRTMIISGITINRHFLAMFIDITELKQTELALKESEKRYKLLSNLTFEGIVIHDSGIAVDLNISFARIFGYEYNEILYQNVIQKLIHPDDIPLIKENVSKHYALPYEVRGLKKDGTVFPVEIEARDFPRDGIMMRVAAVRDITERKKNEKVIIEQNKELQEINDQLSAQNEEFIQLAEQLDSTNKELAKSEERYRYLADNSTDIIAMLTTGLQFSYISPAVERLTGYKPEEYMKLSLKDILTPESFQKAMERKNSRKAGDASERRTELEHIKKDGSTYWGENITKPILDEQNNIAGYLSTTRDITERKKAEMALLENQKKLAYEKDKAQHYLDIAGVMFIALNREGIVTLANRKAAEILGFPEKEIIGKNWFDNFLPKHKTQDVKKIFKQIMNGEIEQVKFVENEIRTKDNGIRIIAWKNSNLYDENNRLIGLLSSGEDITERKKAEMALRESEEKFRGIFRYSNIGIALGDSKGNLINVNDELQRLLVYSKQELLSMNFSDFTHPDDLKREIELYAQLLDGKRDSYRLEKRYINKHNQILWVDVAVTGRRDSNGNIDLFIGMVLDITERKQTELKMIESEKKLKELNAMKDKFFSIIAHDLKSPFSSILGLTELLLMRFDEYDAEKKRFFIQNIYKSTNKTFNLLENLLTWAGSQTGRIKYNPQKINIKSIAKESLSLMQHKAEKKEITLQNNITTDYFAFADKSTVETVFRNLISNALKFTPEKGKIEIDCIEKTEKQTHYFQIRISDTGIGISPDNLNKLFRIDQNVSTLGTDNEKGTGLGLILCKEFIEKNKGKIWVESQKGKGSSFYFTLPANGESRV